MNKFKNIGEIHKVEKTTNFTIIPNEICQSDILFPISKTIIIYLLSLPADWSIVKTQMNKQLGIGRDQFDKGWKQLVEFGYIITEKHFSPKTGNYYFYRVTGNPLTNNPLTNNQCVNKEIIKINNNKEINTNIILDKNINNNTSIENFSVDISILNSNSNIENNITGENLVDNSIIFNSNIENNDNSTERVSETNDILYNSINEIKTSESIIENINNNIPTDRVNVVNYNDNKNNISTENRTITGPVEKIENKFNSIDDFLESREIDSTYYNRIKLLPVYFSKNELNIYLSNLINNKNEKQNIYKSRKETLIDNISKFVNQYQN